MTVCIIQPLGTFDMRSQHISIKERFKICLSRLSPVWQFLDGLFCPWQNIEPTLANLLCHCCKWPKYSYSATLVKPLPTFRPIELL